MTQQRYMRPGVAFAVGKAIEELGELQAALGKVLRWGWMSYNPELPDDEREPNVEWVRREIADVRGALDNLELNLSRVGIESLRALDRNAMNPKITDNDHGEITASINGNEIRGWSYANDAEQRIKMRMAHEFAEGWFQAISAKGTRLTADHPMAKAALKEDMPLA